MPVSTQTAVVLMIVTLVVGVVGGYLGGQAEVASLRDQVSSLQTLLGELEVRDIKGLYIVVDIEGDMKAYKIEDLFTEEPPSRIAQDVVGGVPIIVSWCRVCYSATVFDRRLTVDIEEVDLPAGTVLNFEVVGLYALPDGIENLAFKDDETGSTWLNLNGEPVEGIAVNYVAKLVPVPFRTLNEDTVTAMGIEIWTPP